MKLFSAFVLSMLLAQGAAYAQAGGDPVILEKLFIRRSFATLDLPSVSQRPAVSRERSTGRKVLGGVIGAVGGFFGGGFLGSKIEPDCDCDDPGVKGFLIGAPVGAVIGGILGAKFF